jgi:hypothetical membrane protein
VTRRLRIATLSSGLAPVMLIGGFSWGAMRQPAHYDWVRDTISALAGRAAIDRWIMTTAFVLLGLCHLTTAWGLGRWVLAVGGFATALLAAAPLPAHGSSAAHVVLATVSLVALAVWPVLRTRSDRVDKAAAALLIALLVWFFVALQLAVSVGLAERIVAVAQALWPIVAVRRQSALRREEPAIPF